jgi:splicing factor 3A subunit 3
LIEAKRTMGKLEEQRYIEEDLERLEQGVADRIRDDPKYVSICIHALHNIN